MEFSYCKLEIFVPEDYFAAVRQALWSVDAGHIGEYDRCLSWSRVNSCWRPLEGADPFEGIPGAVSYTHLDVYKRQGLPRSRFLSELQIGYTAESRAGDVLTLEVGEQGGQHFVKGVDEAGKTHFEAAAKFGEEIH